MSKEPELGDSSNEHPLKRTRKRFLSLLGTTAGLSLTGCGYGFVAPSKTTSDQFSIPMQENERAMLAFFNRLPHSPPLREQFIDDPARTMIANGVLEPNSTAVIDRANRLLFYILSKPEFMDKLSSISAKYSGNGSVLRNKFTGNNLNVENLTAAKAEMVEQEVDWAKVFDEQIYAFISDSTVLKILDLEMTDTQMAAFSRRVADSMASEIDGKRPIHPLFALALANAIALANWKYIANANFLANANFNWNWNFNTNYNYNTKGPDVTRNDSLGSWEQFTSMLQMHAKAVASADQV